MAPSLSLIHISRRMKSGNAVFLPEDQSPPALARVGKRCATYPANLCPFLFGAEFSDREEDLGDAVGQAVEDATFTAIGKRTAEHFQHVLCGLE